jgi:Ca2+-binding EF-hand superfamily protein
MFIFSSFKFFVITFSLLFIASELSAECKLSGRLGSMDRNKNCMIEKSELLPPKPKQCLGQKVAIPTIRPMHKKFDFNGNNLVEKAELVKFAKEKMGLDEPKGPIWQNFDVIDCDNNKGADADELKYFFMSKKIAKKNPLFANFSLIDCDGNNILSGPELKKFKDGNGC